MKDQCQEGVLRIRKEIFCDYAAVHALNSAAFETPAEADLVDSLREHAKPSLSLIAEIEKQVVGHIMFSPVTYSGHENVSLMGLAPMAVAPDYQRMGIGSSLVRSGIEQCKQSGFDALVVLGHPRFYPRFGFVPAIQFGINSEYNVPANVFMAQELNPGCLQGTSGLIVYHDAFAKL